MAKKKTDLVDRIISYESTGLVKGGERKLFKDLKPYRQGLQGRYGRIAKIKGYW